MSVWGRSDDGNQGQGGAVRLSQDHEQPSLSVLTAQDAESRAFSWQSKQDFTFIPRRLSGKHG